MYKIFHESFYNASFKLFVQSETTLKEQLAHKPIEDLQMLAYLYQIADVEKKEVEALKELVYSSITSKEHLLLLAYTSLEKQYEIIEKLAIHPHVRPEKVDYEYLMRLITLNMVYMIESEGIIYVHTYPEVYEAMLNIVFTPEMKVKETRLIIECIQACLHLYGVLPHEKCKEIIHHYTGFYIEKNDYYRLLEIGIIKGINMDYDDHFVGIDTIKRSIGFKKYYGYHEEIELDYYLPEFTIFMQYADGSFYEKPQELHELLTFLMESFAMDEAMGLQFIDDICMNYITEDLRHPLEELMEVYRMKFVNEEQKKIFNETIMYFLAFIKSRRMKGYSLEELTKFSIYQQTLS